MRDYANITTAIWRDERFRALPFSPQRTYLMLITQEDISGAGTLPLTTRRWASNAADTTRDDIERDLKVLEAAEFVFVDEDEEELLIRSFVKHDKGYSNPKRRPVILAAALAIRSLKLRRVLWREMARLGLADSLPELPEISMDSLSDRQSDRHPDSHTAENRVVVTVVSTDTSTLNPQSTDSSTQLASLTPSSADDEVFALLDVEPAAKKPTKHDVDAAFARFWDAYPRKVSKGDAEKVFAKVAKSDVDLDAVVAGAVAYRDDKARQRAEIKFTKHPATWLNGQCWLDEPTKENPGTRTSANGHQPYRNPDDHSKYDEDF